jgi:hypothetical protein
MPPNLVPFDRHLLGQWYETVPNPASQTLKSESRRCHSNLVTKKRVTNGWPFEASCSLQYVQIPGRENIRM